MEFFDIVQRRRSVRAFETKPVPAEALQNILECANRAPSAGNLQAYEIYVVQSADARERLAQAALHQNFIALAPLVLVFCAHPKRSAGRYGRRGESLYAIQDATIACTFAMLSAVDLGLACVWVGAFDADWVKNVIQASPGRVPVAILPIGYAAEYPLFTGRRKLDSIVHEV